MYPRHVSVIVSPARRISLARVRARARARRVLSDARMASASSHRVRIGVRRPVGPM
jgi:hypothetical protein